MTFTDTQNKALQAKLSHRHVKTREQNGANLCYVEGWHAIAEANRIFGFDSWDRQTIMPTCIWQAVQRGQTVCFYSTKVRITVWAGGTVTTREGIGTGLGRSPNPEQAHEMALKVSETDATKRALATFGNPFGLALYDRDRHQVTKSRSRGQDVPKLAPPLEPLSLVLSDGPERRFDSDTEFVAAVLLVVESLPSVDAVYAFWTVNLPALTELKGRAEPDDDPVERIIAAMKLRLRAVSRRAAPESKPDLPKPVGETAPTFAPVSLMSRPKEKRLRDKEHLVFVAGQPCLICGRKPAQAHHLRFAQPRAMAMKVSDEFTVPLCNLHHDELHRTGDERAWWARHGIIEPLKFAARLWAASRLRTPADELDESAASPGEGGDARDVPGSTEHDDGRQTQTGGA
jgi:hypothetical protein